ncbi:MAG: pyrimidine 5'-nucleotidase [Candidatus Binatia bacterium]
MTVFLFDLDDTLYSRDLGVVARIDRRINEYMSSRLGIAPGDVDALRRRYWSENGTTLRGLMATHAIDPDEYLRYVHDIALEDLLREDGELRSILGRLDGRKLVFSNSSRVHAAKVLALLGIADRFDAIVTLEDLAYVPKPLPAAYVTVLARAGAAPAECLIVEDTLHNLVPARQMGMRTVWIGDPARPDPAADAVIARIHEIERVLEERG